jgi:hypothetical protein
MGGDYAANAGFVALLLEEGREAGTADTPSWGLAFPDTSRVTNRTGSWTLIDVATKSFGANFALGGGGWSKSGTVWTKAAGRTRPKNGSSPSRVRAGAPAFSGTPSPKASQHRITYIIEGSSTTLTSFPTQVNVVPTAVTANLPAPNVGYEYRSFSLSGSNGLLAKGFLRSEVTQP